jgi:hypothetical protein
MLNFILEIGNGGWKSSVQRHVGIAGISEVAGALLFAASCGDFIVHTLDANVSVARPESFLREVVFSWILHFRSPGPNHFLKPYGLPGNCPSPLRATTFLLRPRQNMHLQCRWAGMLKVEQFGGAENGRKSKRRHQLVRHGSAKAEFGDSIPTVASSKCFTINSLYKFCNN